MVPESEIGVDKKFSFSGDQLSQPPNQQQRPNQLVSPYQERRGPGQQRFNNRPFNNCKILIYTHARLSFPQACFTREMAIDSSLLQAKKTCPPNMLTWAVNVFFIRINP